MRLKKKKVRKSVRAILAADYLPRRALADALIARINQLGLSRDVAAKLVGDAASQLSRLMTGHIEEFSADRLTKMLGRLGVHVNMDIYVPISRVIHRERARVAVGRGSRTGKVYHGR